MAKAKLVHEVIEQTDTDLEVGKCYYFMGMKNYVGKLVRITGPKSVILVQASWVADSGRHHEFMRDGKTANMEIEPTGKVCTHWEDWFPWPHPLFTESV